MELPEPSGQEGRAAWWLLTCSFRRGLVPKALGSECKRSTETRSLVWDDAFPVPVVLPRFLRQVPEPGA